MWRIGGRQWKSKDEEGGSGGGLGCGQDRLGGTGRIKLEEGKEWSIQGRVRFGQEHAEK